MGAREESVGQGVGKFRTVWAVGGRDSIRVKAVQVGVGGDPVDTGLLEEGGQGVTSITFDDFVPGALCGAGESGSAHNLPEEGRWVGWGSKGIEREFSAASGDGGANVVLNESVLVIVDQGRLLVDGERGDGREREGGGLTSKAVAGIMDLVDEGCVICVAPDPNCLQGGVSRAPRDGREESVP